MPRLDIFSGGSIPVLDHRKTPSPWSSPNRSSTSVDDDPLEIPDVERGNELTPAEHARTIVANGRTGTLALVVGDPAAPIGFTVNYSTTEDGNPIVCIGHAIERVGSVTNGSAASFTVPETPLTAMNSAITGGVTLLGKLESVGKHDISKLLVTHSRVHGADEVKVRREDARLYAIRVVAILVSGGSRSLAKLSFGEYSAANVDPLAAVAPGLASHLSGDKNGSLVLLARAYSGYPEARSAELMGIDRLGMDLMVTTPQSREPVRLAFPQPVSTPEEVRRELNTLVRGARFKLGVG